MKMSSVHSPRCLASLMMMQRRRCDGRVWLVTSLLALFWLAVFALSVFVLADFFLPVCLLSVCLLPVCLLPMESAQKHQRRKPGGCAFGSLQNFLVYIPILSISHRRTGKSGDFIFASLARG